MKAKDLIKILEQYLESEVEIGYEEQYWLSEYTSGTSDVHETIEAVYKLENKIILSKEHYLIGDKIN